MSEEESSSNSNGEYEVEAILGDRTKKIYDKNKKRFKSIQEFLIKWVGYKKKTWEPTQNLENCKEILNDYIQTKKKNSPNSPNKMAYSKKNKITKLNSIENSLLSYKSKENNKYAPKLDNNENNKNNTIINNNISEKDKPKIIFTTSKINKEKSKKLNKKNEKDNINYDNIDFDIDIIDGNESPLSNKSNLINKNDFNSESTFDPINNIENNSQYSTKEKILQKKRKRNNIITDESNYSISIDDPNMKFENLNKNNSKNDNSSFMGISQIAIPKNQNEKFSYVYKMNKNNNILLVSGKSSNLNIPTQEILKCYEKILIDNLGGKTIHF